MPNGHKQLIDDTISIKNQFANKSNTTGTIPFDKNNPTAECIYLTVHRNTS